MNMDIDINCGKTRGVKSAFTLAETLMAMIVLGFVMTICLNVFIGLLQKPVGITGNFLDFKKVGICRNAMNADGSCDSRGYKVFVSQTSLTYKRTPNAEPLRCEAIRDVSQLVKILEAPNGSPLKSLDACYILMDDINFQKTMVKDSSVRKRLSTYDAIKKGSKGLAGQAANTNAVDETFEWTGIDQFHGVFLGNGKVLYNMKGKYGLFKTLGSDAIVQDFGIHDSKIANSSNNPVGFLAGTISAEANVARMNIRNVYTLGSSITNSGATNDAVGGLIGLSNAPVRLILSYNDSAQNAAGGLIGHAVDNVWMIDSHNKGSITSTLTTRFNTGGLIGRADGNVTLTRVYSGQNKINSSTQYTGGFIGRSEGRVDISSSYVSSTVQGSRYIDSATKELTGKTEAIGMIIGRSNGELLMTNSYAYGEIASAKRLGGLVGEIRPGAIDDPTYNFSKVYSMVKAVSPDMTERNDEGEIIGAGAIIGDMNGVPVAFHDSFYYKEINPHINQFAGNVPNITNKDELKKMLRKPLFHNPLKKKFFGPQFTLKNWFSAIWSFEFPRPILRRPAEPVTLGLEDRDLLIEYLTHPDDNIWSIFYDGCNSYNLTSNICPNTIGNESNDVMTAFLDRNGDGKFDAADLRIIKQVIEEAKNMKGFSQTRLTIYENNILKTYQMELLGLKMNPKVVPYYKGQKRNKTGELSTQTTIILINPLSEAGKTFDPELHNPTYHFRDEPLKAYHTLPKQTAYTGDNEAIEQEIALDDEAAREEAREIYNQLTDEWTYARGDISSGVLAALDPEINHDYLDRSANDDSTGFIISPAREYATINTDDYSLENHKLYIPYGKYAKEKNKHNFTGGDIKTIADKIEELSTNKALQKLNEESLVITGKTVRGIKKMLLRDWINVYFKIRDVFDEVKPEEQPPAFAQYTEAMLCAKGYRLVKRMPADIKKQGQYSTDRPLPLRWSRLIVRDAKDFGDVISIHDGQGLIESSPGKGLRNCKIALSKDVRIPSGYVYQYDPDNNTTKTTPADWFHIEAVQTQFSGNGYKMEISNFGNKTTLYRGLFARGFTAGVLKNLALKVVPSAASYEKTGWLVGGRVDDPGSDDTPGGATKSIIDNNYVIVDGPSATGWRSGGLLGSANRSLVINNYVHLNFNMIASGKSVGGLIGFAEFSKIMRNYVRIAENVILAGNSELGGFIGNAKATSMEDNYVYAENASIKSNTLTATGMVGGFAGLINMGMGMPIERNYAILKNVAMLSLKADVTEYREPDKYGLYFAGGFAGNISRNDGWCDVFNVCGKSPETMVQKNYLHYFSDKSDESMMHESKILGMAQIGGFAGSSAGFTENNYAVVDGLNIRTFENINHLWRNRHAGGFIGHNGLALNHSYKSKFCDFKTYNGNAKDENDKAIPWGTCKLDSNTKTQGDYVDSTYSGYIITSSIETESHSKRNVASVSATKVTSDMFTGGFIGMNAGRVTSNQAEFYGDITGLSYLAGLIGISGGGMRYEDYGSYGYQPFYYNLFNPVGSIDGRAEVAGNGTYMSGTVGSIINLKPHLWHYEPQLNSSGDYVSSVWKDDSSAYAGYFGGYFNIVQQAHLNNNKIFINEDAEKEFDADDTTNLLDEPTGAPSTKAKLGLKEVSDETAEVYDAYSASVAVNDISGRARDYLYNYYYYLNKHFLDYDNAIKYAQIATDRETMLAKLDSDCKKAIVPCYKEITIKVDGKEETLCDAGNKYANECSSNPSEIKECICSLGQPENEVCALTQECTPECNQEDEEELQECKETQLCSEPESSCHDVDYQACITVCQTGKPGFNCSDCKTNLEDSKRDWAGLADKFASAAASDLQNARTYLGLWRSHNASLGPNGLSKRYNDLNKEGVCAAAYPDIISTGYPPDFEIEYVNNGTNPDIPAYFNTSNPIATYVGTETVKGYSTFSKAELLSRSPLYKEASDRKDYNNEIARCQFKEYQKKMENETGKFIDQEGAETRTLGYYLSRLIGKLFPVRNVLDSVGKWLGELVDPSEVREDSVSKPNALLKTWNDFNSKLGFSDKVWIWWEYALGGARPVLRADKDGNPAE